MDINRALRTATTTGKVVFGVDQTRKSLDSGKARLVILTSNSPEAHTSLEEAYPSIPFHRFPGTNRALGSACGKPFSISVLSVIDAGDSDILSLRKRK